MSLGADPSQGTHGWTLGGRFPGARRPGLAAPGSPGCLLKRWFRWAKGQSCRRGRHGPQTSRAGTRRVPAEPCGKPSWRQPRRAGQGRGPTSGSLSCLGTCTRSAGPAFARPGLTELQRGAPFWMPEVPLGWLMSALPRGSQEEERPTHGRGRARARESESHLEPAGAVRATARCRPQLGPSHPRELPALANPSEPASSPAEPGHSPSRASGVSWRLGTSRPSRERFAHRVSQPPLLGLQIYEFADDVREGSVTPNSTLRARMRSLESKRRAGRNSESPAARSRRRRDTVAPGPSGQCYGFHTPARLVFFGW